MLPALHANLTLMVVIPESQSSWAFCIAFWKTVHIEAACAGMDKYEEMEKIGEGVRNK